jgi:hypothetical protein
MSFPLQELSVMGFWDFDQTGDRHWQWRYVAENTGYCVYSGRFRSRNDCIADAMRHGYLSDTPPVTAASIAEETRIVRKYLPASAGFLNRLLAL